MEFPVFQVVPIALCPVTRHHREESSLCSLLSSHLFLRLNTPQYWTQQARCVSPELSSQDQFPDLPAKFTLTWSRTLVTSLAARAHCWSCSACRAPALTSLLPAKLISKQLVSRVNECNGVIPLQMRDLTFLPIGYHEVPARPILQLVHVPLKGGTPI